jgi:hypothetical protein
MDQPNLAVDKALAFTTIGMLEFLFLVEHVRDEN